MIFKKEKIYEGVLSVLRYYYGYHLDCYLTHYQDNVRNVPNIMNIELPILERKLKGKHPDQFTLLKYKQLYGLFLAKTKTDPVRQALLNKQTDNVSDY